METTEAKIEEILPEESIEDMMYEEDRFWNMTELTDWNDEEAREKPRVFCKTCSKWKCEDCENLQNRYSEEDRKIYKEVWDNVNLVQENGKTRLRAKYISRNPLEETFVPENSNTKTAFSRTNMIIDRLMKKGQMEKFQEEIQKKIYIGCLEELENLLKTVHHFCYLQMYSVRIRKVQVQE